ncbi:MAG TPA: hypothetical protein VLB90_00725 [Pseudomonadales bacterium]|nr:hypothetical protein [Pseudomonadales bacterium]
MKMAKMGILAAAIAMSASVAQAVTPTPPYHVTNGYTGKATLQSAGGCKAKVVYENAQYGSVYDSLDSYIGWGMVADGEVVVIEEGYKKVSSFSDTVTKKDVDSYYENMASAETQSTIESLAGCSIGVLIFSTKSVETYTVDPAKSLDGYEALFPFNGITGMTTEVKGTKTYEKSLKFNGKVMFKGSRPLV